tara:strand:+ start:63 stop:524 length:462 start_codon:yes stop_codon:yes gene_type:complete
MMRTISLRFASLGAELGGSLLFGRRVGFSGTPSDLLPEELGKCEYEVGVDGKIMNYLCDVNVVESLKIGEGWSVRSLLLEVIKSGFHCLIDTGALITGMSNLDVAMFLLDEGLSEELYDGVVFLDDLDRQCILMRSTRLVVRLNQAGVPWARR